MKVTYDYKMRGLLVEVDGNRLQHMAEDICDENDEPELLDNAINHITYIKEETPDQKSNIKAVTQFLLKIIAAWVIFLLAALGLFKLGEWL